MFKTEKQQQIMSSHHTCCHTSLRFTWIWLTGRIRQEKLMGEEPGWQCGQTFQFLPLLKCLAPHLSNLAAQNCKCSCKDRIPSSICHSCVHHRDTQNLSLTSAEECTNLGHSCIFVVFDVSSSHSPRHSKRHRM